MRRNIFQIKLDKKLRRARGAVIRAFNIMALAASTAFAVPADPTPAVLCQPDGTTITARKVGDEYYSRTITDDGYTIMQGDGGWWYYAAPGVDGWPYATDSRAGVDAPPPDVAPGVAPSPASRRALSIRRDARRRAPSRRAAVVSPKGTKEILVLRVDFSDQAGTKTKAYYENYLFARGTYTLRGYYDEVSYEQLVVTGTIVGDDWLRSAKTSVYYGADSATGTDDLNGPIYELAREAVRLADPSVNFADYDKDGDGYVDHVMIVYAGNSQASSAGVDNNIWPHQWSIGEAGEIVDGVTVFNYTMAAENSSMGTFAHEFLHDLGAPDLYDYDYDGTPVGSWCLMSGGSHLSPPCHISGYLKTDIDADPSNGTFGWITPSVVGAAGDIEVKRLADNATGSLYKFFAGGTKEYFLVENRHRFGFDAGLPESGLLIWHIDESMPDGVGRMNDGQPFNSYYRVWVECPGNPLHNSTADKAGAGTLATAAYSSNDNQTSFNNASNPNSNTNRGIYSGVNIVDIGAEGAIMSMTVSGAGIIVPLAGAIPAPNPFYPGKGIMTFAVSEAMGAQNMKIRIYNFAGDKIRDLANSTAWDGKDDHGDCVSTGLYFFTVETTMGKSTGKLTVIK